MNISASDRRALAEQLGINEQYLYQCLTGRKDMRTDEAVRIEQESGGRIRRWHLRVHDWHRHWPELIDHPEAPPVPQPSATAQEG